MKTSPSFGILFIFKVPVKAPIKLSLNAGSKPKRK